MHLGTLKSIKKPTFSLLWGKSFFEVDFGTPKTGKLGFRLDNIIIFEDSRVPEVDAKIGPKSSKITVFYNVFATSVV